MNVTAYNHTSTQSINITWLPIDDEFILERMLGYRVSYRAVWIGDEYVEEGDVPTLNFTVRKTTLDAVIERLDSYTLYQINVSGFSRRGDGPSAITGGGMIKGELFLNFFPNLLLYENEDRCELFCFTSSF